MKCRTVYQLTYCYLLVYGSVMNENLARALERTTRGRRTRSEAPAGTVVAYIRVSTDEQVESGAGMAAQRTAIERAAKAKGWTITEWFEDAGLSGGKSPAQRPGLAAALEAVQSGQAERMVVAKMDRLSRKFRDAVLLMETALDEGWPMYIADIDADMTTQAGRLTCRILAAIAEDERDRIRTRTREALAAKRAAGVRLGRPSSLPREVIERIVADRAAGLGYQRIANSLNADEVPTAQGGARWYPATVRRVFEGQDAKIVRDQTEPPTSDL